MYTEDPILYGVPLPYDARAKPPRRPRAVRDGHNKPDVKYQGARSGRYTSKAPTLVEVDRPAYRPAPACDAFGPVMLGLVIGSILGGD